MNELKISWDNRTIKFHGRGGKCIESGRIAYEITDVLERMNYLLERRLYLSKIPSAHIGYVSPTPIFKVCIMADPHLPVETVKFTGVHPDTSVDIQYKTFNLNLADMVDIIVKNRAEYCNAYYDIPNTVIIGGDITYELCGGDLPGAPFTTHLFDMKVMFVPHASGVTMLRME